MSCASKIQEKNVRAICDIDRSTKTAREKRFIGAKGIGFKSVTLQQYFTDVDLVCIIISLVEIGKLHAQQCTCINT